MQRVSEQLTHFFTGIDVVIGNMEKKALQARNFSAHGSFGGSNIDYIDYGTLGYPEKNINCPSGDANIENL